MKKTSFLLLCNLIIIFCLTLLTNTFVFAETEIGQKQDIESSRYIIDEEDNIVYRVMPETSISSFKSGFNNPGIIKVYTADESGQEVSEDSIMQTGMILENITNNKKYEISVIGDFNGDGRISLVELTRLIRHTVGLSDYKLSGAYEKSADLNNDGNVNHIDITILIRYIVYGKLNIQDSQEIKAPTIEIVEGNVGLDNWYVSNVKFKVVPNPENDENVKTVYKLTDRYAVEEDDDVIGGNSNKGPSEVEVNDDEPITLEDGVYDIVAYSYDSHGFKSLTTRQEIKVDATAPTVGKLNMWINQENGEIYDNDTWTNQSVVVSLTNGKDETSGHLKTSYYIKNDEGTQEEIQGSTTFSESGTYVVVVTTLDNAGNKSEKEYTIKIDNTTIVPPVIKVLTGDKGEDTDWYYNDVVLQIEEQPQEPNASKIVRNTYEIVGTQQEDETDIENNGEITITENGINVIRAYSYNEVGVRSRPTTLEIKRDDTAPNAPIVKVIGGNQQDNNWYVDNVTVQVLEPETVGNLSRIKRMEYKIEGATDEPLTEISNEGTIEISNDGVSTISVYTYNEVGLRSDPTEITIYKDSGNPETAELTYEDLTSDSYTLVCKGIDSISGIASYEIYINDTLKGTVETGKEEIRYDIKDQASGTYSVYIKVKDRAGHITQSDTVEIKMARVEEEKIDHIEFAISRFNVTDEEFRVSKNGVTKLVSDTSLTTQSKYMMLTSDEADMNNYTGLIEGEVRVVLKDGTVLSDIDFFPKDLSIDMEYYTNGSGKNFEHQTEVNFLGNDLNPEKKGDKTIVDSTIGVNDLKNNKFTIREKKLNGVQSYVRVTIKSVKFKNEEVKFKIIDK